MTPNAVFKQLEISLSAIQGLRQYCNEALARADTGIAGLSPREVQLNSLPWKDFPLIADGEKWLLKTIPVGRAMIMAGANGERFTVSGHLKPASFGHFKTGHSEELRPLRRQSQKGRNERPPSEPSPFDTYVSRTWLVRPADRA